MTQYFFDVTNGHRLIDPDGLDCRADKDAVGNVIADQIASDAPDGSGRHVLVHDDERKEVGEVAVSGPEDGLGGLAGRDQAGSEGK
jgi:hypothetical protein